MLSFIHDVSRKATPSKDCSITLKQRNEQQLFTRNLFKTKSQTRRLTRVGGGQNIRKTTKEAGRAVLQAEEAGLQGHTELGEEPSGSEG